ncbi:MAG: ATP-dependent RNA helicase HrpA [Limisphaerales bacterium]
MADPRLEELRTLLPGCLLHDWVRLGARAARVARDPHHAARHGAVLDRILERARASVALRAWRAENVPIVDYPPELPITARKDDIVAAIRSNQVIVLAGETGSGKTTQIPKMCLEAGLGIEAKIGCTQPRRVAAQSISRRIAEELRVEWGREVGCKVRFDDRSSPETFIKLMTDGILLAETQGDPDLSEYNALILDEAHERSLNIDFLLGHLKGLLARRRDLKLIVTSATINTEAFSRAFDDAPVLEVSGRLYPVEVRYRPLDAESEERGDLTFIDAAVRAAEEAILEPGAGDVLIFLPGERDIREASDQLESRLGREVDVIPLFGRLSSGDQQRAFTAGTRPKVVVATNIAETSLTIPGIRYVIDSGLARVSRYTARTRTKRLPVEPVSQSSANQRKGRAGRVRDGICIRLFSEEDFEGRPAETQPEIQRANLAEVILRMKAFHLGDIETFPFLDPPTPAAIRAGYTLLHELGALDDRRELTPLGNDLARLPIDPILGRMLLQSQRVHATRELLIIAAGLSIQDPRERPLDQREAADAAHRKFVDARSDFLTLLNLWNAVHDLWEDLRTQNQRRRFCRTHFLSYTRMREWQDLHAQLHGALEDVATVRLNESSADYGAIHRSILAGLLGHVGQRKERNLYRTGGNRELQVFPGSALHERGQPPPRKGTPGGRQEPKPRPSSQPGWMMAGEIVETSQLFARTLAGIEPQWIVDLAPHLCKVSHRAPHWSASAGRVLIDEIFTLHGLEVMRRKVAYGNLDPAEATAIFIRSALIEEALLPGMGASVREDDDDPTDATGRGPGVSRTLRSASRTVAEIPPQYRFLEHNRKVRQKLEDWQTRLRRNDLGNLEEALARFYSDRLRGVASVDELNRHLRETGGPEALCVREEDLGGGRAAEFDAETFPEAVHVGGQAVPLSYAYAPGEEWDGVTIRLPMDVARTVAASRVEWAIPSLRSELVLELLGSLPKTHRRQLQPFAPKVEAIVRELEPEGPTLAHDLSRFLRDHFGVQVPVTDWRPESLPSHLRPRVEVLGNDRKALASGRDLAQVRAALAAVKAPALDDSAAWRRAARQWERPALGSWSFEDLPERVDVGTVEGLPVVAWPGLKVEEGQVSVRLFRSSDASRLASLEGLRRLVELAVGRDFGWLERDLRGLQKFASAYAPLGPVDELVESAFGLARRHVLPVEALPSLRKALFEREVERTRSRLPGIAQQVIDRIGAVLVLRQQLQQRLGVVSAPVPAAKPPARKSLTDFSQLTALIAANPEPAVPAAQGTLAAELAALVPRLFPDGLSFDRLPHLARYLRALQVRAERAALNPAKDRERAALLVPYLAALARVRAARVLSAELRPVAEEFRWMIEEYKVSVFAQEVGTAVPVSPKRLDALWEKLRMECP